MSVHRPMIRPELAEEIERRRGGVPFQRYVNELLRLGLAADEQGEAGDLARVRAGVQEPALRPQGPPTYAERSQQTAVEHGLHPTPLPKIAPRRS